MAERLDHTPQIQADERVIVMARAAREDSSDEAIVREILALRTQLENKEKRIQELEDVVKRAHEETEAMARLDGVEVSDRDALVRKELKLAALRKQMDSKEMRIKEFEGEVLLLKKELEEKKNAIDKGLESRAAEVSSLREQLEAKATRMTGLEDEACWLREQMAEKETMLAEASSISDQLNMKEIRITGLEDKAASLSAQLKAKETIIADLEDKVASLSKQLEGKETVITGLENETSSLSEYLEANRETIQRLEDEVKKLNSDMETMSHASGNEREALVAAELQEAKVNFLGVYKELEQCRAARRVAEETAANTEKRCRREQLSLQAALEDSRLALQNLDDEAQQQREGLHSALEQLQGELQKLEEEQAAAAGATPTEEVLYECVRNQAVQLEHQSVELEELEERIILAPKGSVGPSQPMEVAVLQRVLIRVWWSYTHHQTQKEVAAVWSAMVRAKAVEASRLLIELEKRATSEAQGAFAELKVFQSSCRNPNLKAFLVCRSYSP